MWTSWEELVAPKAISQYALKMFAAANRSYKKSQHKLAFLISTIYFNAASAAS